MACTSKGANDRRIAQYSKILTLDSITNEIAKLSQDGGLLAKADEKFGKIPRGDFMTTVDLDAPHAWLESHMNTAEARFAYIVTQVLAKDPSAIEQCKDIAYRAGTRCRAESIANSDEALEFYEANVLDGMPCDETKDIVAQEDDYTAWNQLMDLHSKYWEDVKGNSKNYYTLLESFVSGLLSKSGWTFSQTDGKIYSLEKEQD